MDPYRIWLSEVMLQQTQVQSVIPYYSRWLKKFPTLMSVAATNEDTALKLWEGFGYYSRCRNFLRACRIVVDQYGGRVPDDPIMFRMLPGVGDYTAAAVMSIAFGRAIPVVDGNVRRLMARILTRDIWGSKGDRYLRSWLREWIDPRRPGDFNQAMMELGSLVCRPRDPNCPVCPVRSHCRAYATGRVGSFPKRKARRALPSREAVVGIIRRRGKFLIQRRPPEAFLGGLWELPGGKLEDGESRDQCLRREVKEETGLEVRDARYLGSIQHTYSHFRVTIHAFDCRYGGAMPRRVRVDNRRWITIKQVPRYAFPRGTHKVFDLVANHRGRIRR